MLGGSRRRGGSARGLALAQLEPAAGGLLRRGAGSMVLAVRFPVSCGLLRGRRGGLREAGLGASTAVLALLAVHLVCARFAPFAVLLPDRRGIPLDSRPLSQP